MPVAVTTGIADDFLRGEIKYFPLLVAHLLHRDARLEPLQDGIVAAGIGQECNRFTGLGDAHASDPDLLDRDVAGFAVNCHLALADIQFLELGTAGSDPVAEKVGFDHNHGNNLGIEGAELTGEVIEPILDKHAKVEFLDRYCKDLSLNADDCMTIGDGANDLPMLKKAGLGVGYYAKPSVASELTNIIKHGDLSAPLYAQGYTDKEIERF